MQNSNVRPFLLTSIGKKYLMGFTGLVWAGFVLAHMAGNLLIFVGADAYNKYGHAIISNPLLVPAEIFLVLAFLTHIVLAIKLSIENKVAKGSRYLASPSGAKAGSLASRTMAVQGSIVLVFIILHIITFKFGTVYETNVGGVPMRDLHKLIIEVFQQPVYVAWYVVALIVLGFHLKHGFGSVFQSLGLKNDHYAPLINKLSCLYGAIVAIGFLSQPLYVFFFAN